MANPNNFASNLELLKAIETEQPVFWSHLRNIATGLKASEGYYWDEHNYGRLSIKPITHLILVQRLDYNVLGTFFLHLLLFKYMHSYIL